MDDTRWNHIQELFSEALELAPDLRNDFLSRTCGDDAELRREVEDMLEAHEGGRRLSMERIFDESERRRAQAGRSASSTSSGSPVAESGGGSSSNDNTEVSERIGSRVGAYRLQSLLGRGGMGDVYLAVRDDKHYEQQVAVKLIRPGVRMEESADRFRRERQILARLRHPNIATLLDGGVTDDGIPYLVMQYVDGIPITDYCRAHDLSLHQRLQLFRTVCSAVHAAHVQLVVHRDLKPANILVAENGDVTLLDFGIAKLLEPTGDMRSTRPMQRVMTPEHAAPEQVRGEPVRTSTDVYALGVLLYEMLTGVRPLKVTSSDVRDIERVICEVQPAPPSESAPAHKKQLRGDLDNIILKALDKEAGGRYQTAGEMDADIQRYLSGLPVEATRDSFAYRARRFVGRYRFGVAAAVVFVAFVATFIVTTIRQSWKVAEERDRALAAMATEEKVVDVLVGLFEQADPYVVPGGDTLRVGTFIDQSETAIAAMGDEPDVQARLWEAVGGIRRSRSDLARSRETYERALAIYEADPAFAMDALRVRHALAMLTFRQRGAEAAEPLLRASLQQHRGRLGDGHPGVATAMRDLAVVISQLQPDEAITLLQSALEIDRQAPARSNSDLAADHEALGRVYFHLARHAEASAEFEEAIALLQETLSPGHPRVTTVRRRLASVMSRTGDWDAAVAIQRQIVASQRTVLGADALEVASSLEVLAVTLTNQKRHAEAADCFAEALDIFERRLGPDHWRVANAMRNVGVLSALASQPDTALVYLDKSMAIDERKNTVPTTSGISMRSQRAYALYATGAHEYAIAEARRALADMDALSPAPNDANRAEACMVLATLLLDSGGAAEAEPYFREALAGRVAHFGDEHPRVAHARCMLAVGFAAQGDVEAARELLREHYAAAQSWGQAYPLQITWLERTIAVVTPVSE